MSEFSFYWRVHSLTALALSFAHARFSLMEFVKSFLGFHENMCFYDRIRTWHDDSERGPFPPTEQLFSFRRHFFGSFSPFALSGYQTSLPYFHHVPGIQLLHCDSPANEATLFVDGFAVAETVSWSHLHFHLRMHSHWILACNCLWAFICFFTCFE